MKIEYYQVNSFTGKGFRGNPAGVCLLESKLSDEQMQYIAAENNLSETAFLLHENSKVYIRWFTPVTEVDLCGHATLAAASIILNDKTKKVEFQSRSGVLKVVPALNGYSMRFPSDTLEKISIPSSYTDVFGARPLEVLKGKTDFIFVFENENIIRAAKPAMQSIIDIGGRGTIITSPGNEVDFVSRFFGPQSGLPEDPVTGSAHTSLTPYWAKRLGKNQLLAHQLSERGGVLFCNYLEKFVEIEGEVKLYSSGYVYL